MILPNIRPPYENWQNNYSYQDLHQKIAQAALSQGLKVLDLYPELAHYPGPLLVISEQDLHFNQFGNQVIAQILFQFLLINYPELFKLRIGVRALV